ncbi:MAG: hypothetical protein QM756_31930 [Polyangiaceae bacterium]
MAVPDPFDIIAILLGIFLALRKSDVRAEDPARHPQVAVPDFDRWRMRATSAYSLGIRACFAKVMLDYLFLAYLQRNPLDLTLQRALGVSITVGWLLLLIACWVGARRARRLADELHINLVRDPAPSA